MLLKPRVRTTLIILISLICSEVVSGEENQSLSQFARTQKMYPKVTQYEARQLLMADNGASTEQTHPCRRKCGTGEPMACYYYMVVHYDDTMSAACKSYLAPQHLYKSGKEEYIDATGIQDTTGDCKYADGVESHIEVVNGNFPGQAIEVCQGDTIVADVINSLRETTTLHWHGMHQRKAPHMDGVPHVTQYPIEPGQAYRYRFEVDHVGTNWWHSHTNNQRAFGLAGALIVRQPIAEDPHAKLYDFDYSEHIIFMQDWMYNNEGSVPQNLLINGRGRNVNSDPKQPKRATLYEVFKVVRGGRYRFRAIFNGIANCPITLSIDNHQLVVLANDGNDVEPIPVQKITFNAGERFDFVLHANQEVDNYWLRIKGHNFCGVNKLHQEAILRYSGANARVLPQGSLSYAYDAPGMEINPIDKVPQQDKRYISVTDMKAITNEPEPPLRPYRTYYTNMKVDTTNNFLFQMDDITFSMPKVSLLQTRNLGIGGYFCNKTQQAAMGQNCRNGQCKCSNVIQVPAFKHLEFVISSSSASTHPVHLHGYTFRVVGMGVLGEGHIHNIEQIDRQTPLPRRSSGAPLKDTVEVPAFGYTIVRFYTDSPGYWLFHCHISPHAENGMAAVVRVGEDTEMKMCPVSNCGLCSSVL